MRAPKLKSLPVLSMVSHFIPRAGACLADRMSQRTHQIERQQVAGRSRHGDAQPRAGAFGKRLDHASLAASVVGWSHVKSWHTYATA